ncbi:endonuclease V [Oceanithermus sp.]
MSWPPFPTPPDLKTAAELQKRLTKRVELAGEWSQVRAVAALDASIKRGGDLVAAAVLWDLKAGSVREVTVARLSPEEVFPYIPGYLSFREAPVYLRALKLLNDPPDALLVDGQGIAHPRGLGVATHLGVHTGLPSIGVAKSRLFGQAVGELGLAAGNAVPLCDRRAVLGEPCGQGLQVGWIFRSRDRVKPIYVSPGHRVSLADSLDFVASLPRSTKLPEPLRQAHLWAGRARRKGLEGRVFFK